MGICCEHSSSAKNCNSSTIHATAFPLVSASDARIIHTGAPTAGGGFGDAPATGHGVGCLPLSLHGPRGSHCNLQVGLGQCSGALQFHLQTGSSQILRHGCTPGHFSWHCGSEQVVLQWGHDANGQSRLGQRTQHCGSLHSTLHVEVSTPEQRVSHRGGWQVGVQTWSHLGLSHCHMHFGMQPPVPNPARWKSLPMGVCIVAGRVTG